MPAERVNAGFATMRSNVSSPTGSQRFPSRNSIFPTPFNAALNRTNRSARGFRSVAITRSWSAAVSPTLEGRLSARA